MFLLAAGTNDPSDISAIDQSADQSPFEFLVGLSAAPRCTAHEAAVRHDLVAFARTLSLADVYQNDAFLRAHQKRRHRRAEE